MQASILRMHPIASLERHVPTDLWHKPIDRIEAPELLDAVAKATLKYPETGRRVRQRLELVFADAEFHKLCTGNPGRAIREKVREQCGGRRTRHRQAHLAADRSRPGGWH